MKFGMTSAVVAVAVANCWALPAHAQDADSAAIQQELAEMRAMMGRMAERIDTLEAELAEAEAKADAAQARAGEAVASAAAAQESATAHGSSPAIAFKGAPEIKGEGGWSFKPRGRLMYDTGFTSVPGTTGRDDGFGSEVRRARLGVQGDMPGGFGYKFEMDFAGNEVEVADAFISYEAGDAEIAVGHQNNFQSLEELTSSLNTSFIERAAFTDAFGFERRIGIGATYGTGIVLAQAGIFTDNFDDTATGNIGGDARLVLMPTMGDAQLHFGGSVHYNDIKEDGASVRYRQRPLVHFTSERFVNTGNIAATSETGFGLEAAAIAGPFHAAGEAFWQQVGRIGDLDDATFFGGYAEVGYFLTGGDSRGYKGGKFDRIKPANPVGDGGFGAVQVNLRYDYLDLNDADIVGGKQDGYMASLIWSPTAYTRLMANYARLSYTDAFYEAAGGDTSYGVDAFGVRAQIDF